MLIAILTPIEIEYLAVRRHLINIQSLDLDDITYEEGAYIGQHHKFHIIIRQTGSKNSDIALATERVIKSFDPIMILLVGIAGGIKDVAIGDIVVATKAYGYESGKEQDGGFVARPEAIPFDTALIDIAKTLSRDNRWQHDSTKPAKVVFGPIASGDKVVATQTGSIYHILKQHYNDTVAIEMESIGFAKAMLPYRHIRALNIRSISDLLDNKNVTDQEGGQELAAARAAAFAFSLLEIIDFKQLKIYAMDMKELIQKILSIIFPIMKSEALQKIGSDLGKATDTTILGIWDKVKPLFIEEIAELKANPHDADVAEEVQLAARKKLRQALQANDELKQDLESLVQEADAKNLGSNVTITNSKNVVQGSQITVGGDFRLGDNK